MGTGTHQVQFFAFDTVNHQPIRLDMDLPVSLPNAPERMVEIAWGQRLLLDQGCQQRPQLIYVLAPRRGPSYVALELRGSNRVEHVLDVEVAEQFLGATETLALALIQFLHGP